MFTGKQKRLYAPHSRRSGRAARGHRRAMFAWALTARLQASPSSPGRRGPRHPRGELFSFFTTQGIILTCLDLSGFRGPWNPRRLGQ